MSNAQFKFVRSVPTPNAVSANLKSATAQDAADDLLVKTLVGKMTVPAGTLVANPDYFPIENSKGELLRIPFGSTITRISLTNTTPTPNLEFKLASISLTDEKLASSITSLTSLPAATSVAADIDAVDDHLSITTTTGTGSYLVAATEVAVGVPGTTALHEISVVVSYV